MYETAVMSPLDEELTKKEILIMEQLDHPNIVKVCFDIVLKKCRN